MEWYIGTEWSMERKGLYKKVLDLKFSKLEKPSIVAKCWLRVSEVERLNGKDSKYLAAECLGDEQLLEMGTALTPIDFYLEVLVQQMIEGETARCQIRTVSQPTTSEALSFVLTLERIEHTRDFHTLKHKEVHALALRYKENGVIMFKSQPRLAHDYFTRAAKCLISYKPFERLTQQQDGINGSELATLLEQVQTNLAACLLAEKRYEDVIYQTQFIENTKTEVSVKAIYRRALAYYHLKEFELAQQLIERRVPDYQQRREFTKLLQNVLQSWKSSKEDYKCLVQRMFT